VSEVQHTILFSCLFPIRCKVSPYGVDSLLFTTGQPVQNHDRCSEVFYREEVQSDIKTAPSSTVQERRQMVELLKRFEESSLEDEEEDVSNDEFSERLTNVDIGGYPTIAACDTCLLNLSSARYRIYGRTLGAVI
jgi:hypothetical protein